VLLLAIVVCVLAQTPNKPIWPDGWSATVRVHNNRERHPGFFRWFWDKAQNKDRIDGIVEWKNEMYLAETIFDHAAGKEYRVYYQGGLVNCFDRPINSTLPKPDFSKFNYVGKAIVNYEPAYQWFFDDKLRGVAVALFDRQDNREILRIDVDDRTRRRSESFIFLEYQVGAQAPEIFQIEKIILDQCNDEKREF